MRKTRDRLLHPTPFPGHTVIGRPHRPQKPYRFSDRKLEGGSTKILPPTWALANTVKAPLPKGTPKGSYSGKFVVRVDKGLHQALTVAALREGKSLHAYCVGHLQRAVRVLPRSGQSTPVRRARSRKK
ncbi:MAG: toxin-antitoxin system HicB family antitoxin [Nitrospiraceae bacterium]|nr:toxin-antitoxin system HicB family antitoxin [Nitrospiraceae bacterium]